MLSIHIEASVVLLCAVSFNQGAQAVSLRIFDISEVLKFTKNPHQASSIEAVIDEISDIIKVFANSQMTEAILV